MKRVLLIFIFLWAFTLMAAPMEMNETEPNNTIGDAQIQTISNANVIVLGASNGEQDIWLLDPTTFPEDVVVKKINGHASVKVYVSDFSDYSGATVHQTVSSSFAQIDLDPTKFYYVNVSSGSPSGYRIQIATPAALPVELIYFKSNSIERGVHLEWATATEKNVDIFLVEWSRDGQYWTTKNTLPAKGESIEKIKYEYLDEEPKKGMNYYRLKIMDLDKSYEYSDVVSVAYDQKETVDVQVGPNPFSDFIDLNFNNYNKNYSVVMIDMNGISSWCDVREQADGRISLNTSELPAGIYFLKICSKDLNKTIIVNKINY